MFENFKNKCFLSIQICTNMGGRKFRLAVHRKNEERKKRQKKCDAIMVQETNEDTTASVSALTCPISLSLAAFTSAHVQSLLSYQGVSRL